MDKPLSAFPEEENQLVLISNWRFSHKACESTISGCELQCVVRAVIRCGRIKGRRLGYQNPKLNRTFRPNSDTSLNSQVISLYQQFC